MKKILFLLLFIPNLIFGQNDPNIIAMQAMGSVIKAITVGINPSVTTGSSVLTDNRIYLTPVYLDKAATITGVKVFMGTQGVYTADNNNKVGLYSISGGTATLRASCANDGNLWKAAANTLITKAFSSTYAASVGIYYVATLYNQSAETTPPTLARGTSLVNAAVAPVDFTNSNTLSGYTTGNDLPATITMSTLTAHTAVWLVAIY